MVAPSTPGPPCPSKDSDARHHNRPFRRYEGRQDEQEEGTPPAAVRRSSWCWRWSRASPTACTGRVSTVRASFPQTTGTLKVPGLTRPGRGQARRLRRSADLRRQRRGPVHGPGLRPGAGPLLGDGRPPPHDVGPALGDVRQRPGRHRRLPAHPGLARVAQQEYDTKLSPATKQYLQAYAEGVNAYLKGKDGKDISVEYAALGLTNDYKPEAWTPVDSVAWLKAMAWDLRGNMQDEIDRSLMTSRLSPKQINDLYPAYPSATAPPHRATRARTTRPTGKFDPQRAATASDGASRHRPGRTPGHAEPARGALRHPRQDPGSCSAPTAAASAPTPGWCRASTRRPACRCSPTTRTSRR